MTGTRRSEVERVRGWEDERMGGWEDGKMGRGNVLKAVESYKL